MNDAMRLAPPLVSGAASLANSFIGKVIQICVVTRDHRACMEGFARMGIGPWAVFTADQSNTSDVTYHGKPAPFEIRCCIARSANMEWEIIEPVARPSIYWDHLERHGEGLHHVAVDCGGIPYAGRLSAFAVHGYHVVQSGLMFGCIPFHYFSTESDTGTIFEIYDEPPGFDYSSGFGWFPAPPPKG